MAWRRAYGGIIYSRERATTSLPLSVACCTSFFFRETLIVTTWWLSSCRRRREKCEGVSSRGWLAKIIFPHPYIPLLFLSLSLSFLLTLSSLKHFLPPFETWSSSIKLPKTSLLRTKNFFSKVCRSGTSPGRQHMTSNSPQSARFLGEGHSNWFHCDKA